MLHRVCPPFRWLISSALLLMGVIGHAPPADAATTCSASTLPLLFGSVTGDTPVDGSSQVSIECNTLGLSVLGRARVRMCLNIGDGTGGTAGTVDRFMDSPDGDSLRFQIYRDSARTLIWGSTDTPARPTPVHRDLEYEVPLLGGSGGTTVSMFGRIPAQEGLAAGDFESALTGVHTRLDYRYNEYVLVLPSPFPDSCTSGGLGGGSISFGFIARATVPDRCTIDAATDLDFGSVPGLIDAPVDQDATITLTCTRRTAWDVGLDNGQHAAGDTRRMQLDGGTSHVTYELFRDPARTLRWGSTPGTDAEPGEGTGFQQQVTVHGRVPAGQAVPAGQYRDTVTVTVTY